MDTSELGHVVWCDLVVAQLKIHSRDPWNTKMVSTSRAPDPSRPTVEVFICAEDDDVFDGPRTYREKMMPRGSYRGHHFGPPARLRVIDDTRMAISHPDPGTIIWSLVVKYVLTVFAGRAGLLHLKGAAVAHRGRAFLFLGRGGSGKTEIVRTLTENGAGLMANTHLLVDDHSVCGVRSNVRVRDGGRDVYLPLDRPGHLAVHEGWLPVGAVFWVNYRDDGRQLLERVPPRVARANLRYFAESISNWEIKEDIADQAGSDPFVFAEHVNRTEDQVDAFCTDHPVYYANLDVRSADGKAALMEVLDAVRRD